MEQAQLQLLRRMNAFFHSILNYFKVELKHFPIKFFLKRDDERVNQVTYIGLELKRLHSRTTLDLNSDLPCGYDAN